MVIDLKCLYTYFSGKIAYANGAAPDHTTSGYAQFAIPPSNVWTWKKKKKKKSEKCGIKFCTTVQIQNKIFLKDQSDQGLHCLPFNQVFEKQTQNKL